MIDVGQTALIDTFWSGGYTNDDWKALKIQAAWREKRHARDR
jgi:hypothetical protein